ncbi:MAG: tRNA (adenosine(37)-N6)-threonylcarbamoyltransferase complex dimerization subunit type 1 TsaB [Treponema sp.]|nr:tRNA (adenosine(37)-N6)-threonylcarbamoyltransferase complex dimerization subunit type 1 TsaB [Treponema sp.]
MNTILAIDSFSSLFSAALLYKEELFYIESDAQLRQSELAMVFIDDLFKKANIKPNELNGVLCMQGPGSFTGLRIGYSIAKGLALSLSIPFAAVPTLDCIALNYSGLTFAVTEAIKSCCFYAVFDNGKRLTEDKEGSFHSIAEEVEIYLKKAPNIAITGKFSPLLNESLLCFADKVTINNEKRGYAKDILTIAKNRKILDNDCDAYLFEGPQYLRNSV